MTETSAERVMALVREGRKIEAIQVVREETGASLKDALRTVDALTAPEAASGGVTAEARALVGEGRDVEAIRLLRQKSGLGLKEARDVVDAMPRPPEAVRSRKTGAVLVLLVLVAVIVLTMLLS